jgi:hypothetical protein
LEDSITFAEIIQGMDDHPSKGHGVMLQAWHKMANGISFKERLQ